MVNSSQSELLVCVCRILILDWDVHHGNGIQNCFVKDPRLQHSVIALFYYINVTRTFILHWIYIVPFVSALSLQITLFSARRCSILFCVFFSLLSLFFDTVSSIDCRWTSAISLDITDHVFTPQLLQCCIYFWSYFILAFSTFLFIVKRFFQLTISRKHVEWVWIMARDLTSIFHGVRLASLLSLTDRWLRTCTCSHGLLLNEASVQLLE